MQQTNRVLSKKLGAINSLFSLSENIQRHVAAAWSVNSDSITFLHVPSSPSYDFFFLQVAQLWYSRCGLGFHCVSTSTTILEEPM